MKFLAKKEGFKPIELDNRKMAFKFFERGWTVEVYKNGKKIRTIYPIDKEGQK